jgi:hypothetical protein
MSRCAATASPAVDADPFRHDPDAEAAAPEAAGDHAQTRDQSPLRVDQYALINTPSVSRPWQEDR